MRKWYNNGTEEKLVQDGEFPGDGFVRGRINTESDETRKKKSEHCWTRNASKEQMELRNSKISATKRNKSKEEKEAYSKAISEARKGKGTGITPWNKGKVGVQVAWNKGLSTGSNWNEFSAKKAFDTKIRNGSFKKVDTIAEIELYNILLKFFEKDDIVHPYRDEERYPFNCDFYIRSLDLFIELNRFWTHGGRPFDPDDERCKEQLSLWEERAKTSQFFKNAIDTWTVRDVKKFSVAKDNKLNYICFYKESSTTIESILTEYISKIENQVEYTPSGCGSAEHLEKDEDIVSSHWQ